MPPSPFPPGVMPSPTQSPPPSLQSPAPLSPPAPPPPVPPSLVSELIELTINGAAPAANDLEEWSRRFRDSLALHLHISTQRIIIEYIRAGSVICGVRLIDLPHLPNLPTAYGAAVALQAEVATGFASIGAFAVTSCTRVLSPSPSAPPPPLPAPLLPLSSPPTPPRAPSELAQVSSDLSGSGSETTGSLPAGVLAVIVFVVVALLACVALTVLCLWLCCHNEAPARARKNPVISAQEVEVSCASPTKGVTVASCTPASSRNSTSPSNSDDSP